MIILFSSEAEEDWCLLDVDIIGNFFASTTDVVVPPLNINVTKLRRERLNLSPFFNVRTENSSLHDASSGFANNMTAN